MKPERQGTESTAGCYLNTSAYLSANSRKPALLKEQAPPANCQVIVDLYTMLLLKCRPVTPRLSEF